MGSSANAAHSAAQLAVLQASKGVCALEAQTQTQTQPQICNLGLGSKFKWATWPCQCMTCCTESFAHLKARLKPSCTPCHTAALRGSLRP